MDYNIQLLTKNECYTSQFGKVDKKPLGIVVHSTGANNPNLRRYVQPDDGRLGTHPYGNHFNIPGLEKCVHAMIGKDKDGKVCTYQTLPLNICAWGVGRGSKGSYNYDPMYLQFEVCEDALTDEAYYNQAMSEAKELCAKWCKKFDIPIENIVSHKEAHELGYASNHGDVDHWLEKFGDTMDNFRDGVSALIKKEEAPTDEKTEKEEVPGNVDTLRDKLLKIAELIGEIAKAL